MRVFCDTSVFVAACVRKHPHFAQAFPVIQRICNRKDRGYLAAHSLAETYAVLTALPLSPRIHPTEAWRIIQDNMLRHCEMVTLTLTDYRATIQDLSNQGFTGGAIYDALILRSAVKCSCDRIYTFHAAHFQRLAPALADKITVP